MVSESNGHSSLESISAKVYNLSVDSLIDNFDQFILVNNPTEKQIFSFFCKMRAMKLGIIVLSHWPLCFLLFENNP